MKISRGTLLAKLNEASPGLAKSPTIEQSDCFVFSDGKLITFNDEIMVRTESPVDFELAVNANDLLAILSKFPDDEVEIEQNDKQQLVISTESNRRGAKIACIMDIALHTDAVEPPAKWHKLAEGCAAALHTAALTAGENDSEYLTTCIHITPKMVEATDNYRLLRIEGVTGFPDRVLIPAACILKLENQEIVKVGLGEGWVHFKNANMTTISIRCSHEEFPLTEELLTMEDAESLTLPATLGDMISRVSVTANNESKTVNVLIKEGELTITARKEGAEFWEKKKVKYEGRDLAFDVSPEFLSDILKRTRDVEINDNKMKISSGNIQFVVSLMAKSDNGEEVDQ